MTGAEWLGSVDPAWLMKRLWGTPGRPYRITMRKQRLLKLRLPAPHLAPAPRRRAGQRRGRRTVRRRPAQRRRFVGGPAAAHAGPRPGVLRGRLCR